ncbi:phage head morphogenesis protein, partial [Pseudoalteromonas sp. S16_S37]|nr:phage head morphogenesis protein [Pseudoalteromonas sp. S16_S37]
RIERYQAAKLAKDKQGLREFGPRPQHKTVVSFLDDEINQKLLNKGIDPARTLILSERALAHAHSEKHLASGQALAINEYASLSAWINTSAAQVLWEPARNEVLYIVNQGAQSIKVVVRFEDKGAQLDTVINVFKVESSAIEQGEIGGLYERWR